MCQEVERFALLEFLAPAAACQSTLEQDTDPQQPGLSAQVVHVTSVE